MSEPAPSTQPKNSPKKNTAHKTLETSPRTNSRIETKTQETKAAGRQKQEDNRGAVGRIIKSNKVGLAEIPTYKQKNKS